MVFKFYCEDGSPGEILKLPTFGSNLRLSIRLWGTESEPGFGFLKEVPPSDTNV